MNVNVQQAKLPPSLAKLDKLAILWLIGGCFKVNFDWKACKALERLTCNSAAGVMPDLLGVAGVASLRYIRFCYSRISKGTFTVQLIDTVGTLLAHQRPEVEVSIKFV